jgi:hypothetical protein
VDEQQVRPRFGGGPVQGGHPPREVPRPRALGALPQQGLQSEQVRPLGEKRGRIRDSPGQLVDGQLAQLVSLLILWIIC